jgi:hypothetical protein
VAGESIAAFSSRLSLPLSTGGFIELIQHHQQPEQKGKRMKTLRKHWNGFAPVVGASVAAIILFMTLWVWGQSEPPVLTIAPLGSNQFSIAITNGESNGEYILYWVSALGAGPDSWQPLSTNVGKTNWIVDGTGFSSLFFQVIVGADWDGDGIPNWMDASPNDPGIGALTITIDSPLNGAAIQ